MIPVKAFFPKIKCINDISLRIQTRVNMELSLVIAVQLDSTLGGAQAGISTLGILEFNYLSTQVLTYTQKKAA